MENVRTPSMKRGSAAFLQGVVVVIGVGALALLLWEPHLEGRNRNSTVFEVYFRDPFLAFVYVGAIPFFVAVYQAFRVLGMARRDGVISQAAVRALRTIKYCAIAIIGFVAVGEVIILFFNDSDDRAGGVMMGVVIALGCVIVATAAATVGAVLQNAVDMKSENDLTV